VDVRIESRVEGGATVVTIGGRLVASTVRELLNLCESVEGVLVLDLSGLVFADARGLEALRELEERGAELRGASPFIRLLKNGDPTGDRPLRGP
jgi:anti-anti-sigma regulatory factor